MLAIMSTGLLMHQSADINRDGSVDLKDAIVNVREVVQSADDPSIFFSSSVENAIIALQVTAGLKTVIKQSRNSNSTDRITALDLRYLASPMPCNYTFDVGVRISENEYNPFKSIENSPVKPPPRSMES